VEVVISTSVKVRVINNVFVDDVISISEGALAINVSYVSVVTRFTLYDVPFSTRPPSKSKSILYANEAIVGNSKLAISNLNVISAPESQWEAPIECPVKTSFLFALSELQVQVLVPVEGNMTVHAAAV
jgi:hypothetical protein